MTIHSSPVFLLTAFGDQKSEFLFLLAKQKGSWRGKYKLSFNKKKMKAIKGGLNTTDFNGHLSIKASQMSSYTLSTDFFKNGTL